MLARYIKGRQGVAFESVRNHDGKHVAIEQAECTLQSKTYENEPQTYSSRLPSNRSAVFDARVGGDAPCFQTRKANKGGHGYSESQTGGHDYAEFRSQPSRATAGDSVRWERATDSPLCVPMQLIGIRDDGKLVVDPECADRLSSVDDELSVVCVIGPYRTGKSYLLNYLAGCAGKVKLAGRNSFGHDTRFSTSNAFAEHTKGVWIWGALQSICPNTKKKKMLLLMDTEGLNDTENDGSKRDLKLFTLAVLLSSYLVLNTRGPVELHTITDLSTVADLSMNIRVNQRNKAEGNGNEHLAALIPPLLWVLRDFELATKDSNDQYLERLLEVEQVEDGPNRDEIETTDRIRESIKSLFLRRRLIRVSYPGNFRGRFTEQIEEIKHMVLSNVGPMKHGERPMTCAEYCEYLKTFVSVLNTPGEVPCIHSAWEQIEKMRCEKAMKDAFRIYERGMAMFMKQNSPCNPGDIFESHKRYEMLALDHFADTYQGSSQLSVANLCRQMAAFADVDEDASPDERNICGGLLAQVLQDNMLKSQSLRLEVCALKIAEEARVRDEKRKEAQALEEKKQAAREMEALKQSLAEQQATMERAYQKHEEHIKKIMAEKERAQHLADSIRREAELKALSAANLRVAVKPKFSDRFALVIGNGKYSEDEGPLNNPVNDARAMSACLYTLGFQVQQAEDCSTEAMHEAIDMFMSRLTPGCCALFFFSGHGSEFEGRNRLYGIGPTRADPVYAQDVARRMTKTASRLNILILDACRSRPATRGAVGLAPMIAASETIIGFATSPKSVASDGRSGENSPYTRALLEHLPCESSLVEILTKVAQSVKDATRGKQMPWFNSGASDLYYLN